MSNKLLKQLVKSGAINDFKQMVFSSIDNAFLGYKPSSKPDKTIASDIKGFIIAKELVEKSLGSLEVAVKLEEKKGKSFK